MDSPQASMRCISWTFFSLNLQHTHSCEISSTRFGSVIGAVWKKYVFQEFCPIIIEWKIISFVYFGCEKWPIYITSWKKNVIVYEQDIEIGMYIFTNFYRKANILMHSSLTPRSERKIINHRTQRLNEMCENRVYAAHFTNKSIGSRSVRTILILMIQNILILPC